MDIATGAAEQHPTPLPLDASESPATAAGTPIVPVASGPGDSGPLVGGVMPTTAMNLEQMAAGEADCRAAQASGMAAEHDRRAHYAADILPLGAAYGDAVDLPVVPEAATGPAGGFLYPFSGDEPVPEGAGFVSGDVPGR